VNKVDGERHEALLTDFYRLGVANILPLSAQHGPGFSDLMDELGLMLPETAQSEASEEAVMPRIAVIDVPMWEVILCELAHWRGPHDREPRGWDDTGLHRQRVPVLREVIPSR